MPDAHQFSAVIPVSPSVLGDSPDLGALFVAASRDLMDSMDKPTYGPRRVWRWVREDDSYLADLDPEALLIEAKRLHDLAAAWFDPDHGYDDAEDLAHIARREWEHRSGHGPGFGFDIPRAPWPEGATDAE